MFHQHIVFTGFKISRFFNVKDPMPKHLKSHVVYLFSCPGCNASYVGETTRHLKTRVNEHFRHDSSHIFRHFSENPSCYQGASFSDFKIIDNSQFPFTLKLKEAYHINKIKPSLNQQIKHSTFDLLQ